MEGSFTLSFAHTAKSVHCDYQQSWECAVVATHGEYKLTHDKKFKNMKQTKEKRVVTPGLK